jgi:ABC-type multidrug transport system ATPase subunit
LAAVDFDVDEGECVCVVGRSGSGKTTLLRCLSWLERPTTGSIQLLGREPREWGAAHYRAEVHYVPQHPPPLGESPRAFERRVQSLSLQDGRATRSALGLAKTWGFAEASWDRPFDELSGGERQRVLVALALSRQARLLLLDEPMSALDPATRGLVEADLAGVASILVTHDPEQAARMGTRTLRLSP